jgi:hypothetical protein
MEEAIRYQIELTKNWIRGLQKDHETETSEQMRAWIRGVIVGAEHELNTLEDMLLKWEEYQKHGNVVPF